MSPNEAAQPPANNTTTSPTPQARIVNQYGAQKLAWNPEYLYTTLRGMRQNSYTIEQMLQKLPTYHENWKCSKGSLIRKLRELNLLGAKAQGYKDSQVEEMVRNEYNDGHTGIRDIQKQLRMKEIMVGRDRIMKVLRYIDPKQTRPRSHMQGTENLSIPDAS